MSADPVTIYGLALETVKFAMYLAKRWKKESPSCSIVRDSESGKLALYYIKGKDRESKRKGRCIYERRCEAKIVYALAVCSGGNAAFERIGVLERGSWSSWEEIDCFERPDIDLPLPWGELDLVEDFDVDEEIARLG